MKLNRIPLWTRLSSIVIIAAAVSIWLARSAQKTPENAQKDSISTAGSHIKPLDHLNAVKESRPDPAAVKAGLEALFTGMQKLGGRIIDKPDQLLNEAIASHDERAISEALTDLIYSGRWSRDQMIAVLKETLKTNDSWLWLAAARKLYVIGDQSGRSRLVELLALDDPVYDFSPALSSGKYDRRIISAEILGKFRDAEAAQALLMLYNKTLDRRLLVPLVKTGSPEVVQILKDVSGNQPSVSLMELYGLSKAKSESPLFVSVQRDPSIDMPVRIAAAWANTRVSNDGDSAKFIRDFIETQMVNRASDNNIVQTAVKYLGTLNDAESISLLERIATQSNGSDLVQVATANLILNHSNQSSVGTKLVIAEFTKPTKLGLDFAVKLAAASNDPALTQAGQAFDDRRQVEWIWKQQGADRLKWSVWGWADDYVLEITKR